MVEPPVARGTFALVRAGVWGKRTWDRRGWVEFVRREAIIRALSLGDIADEKVTEAADMIVEILSSIPVPNETQRGFGKTIGRWAREWVTHGARYPQYIGPWGPTFYQRLIQWIQDAVETRDGCRALDHAGFPDVEDRNRIFANLVRQETRGLLVDSRPSGGQNIARLEMAHHIERDRPVATVRNLARTGIKVGRAFALGIVTGLTTELLFADNPIDAIGVGLLTFTGSLAAEIAPTVIQALSPDIQAARRGVRKWLEKLPVALGRYLRWPGGRPPASARRTGLPALAALLTAISEGRARLEGVADSTFPAQLERYVNQAGQANDVELRALLFDVQNSFAVTPEDLPETLFHLMVLVDESSRDTEDEGTYFDIEGQLVNPAVQCPPLRRLPSSEPADPAQGDRDDDKPGPLAPG